MKTKFVEFVIGAMLVAAIAPVVSAKDASEIVVDGEHLTIRTATDSQFSGYVAYRYLAPKKWRDTNQIVWDTSNYHLPAKVAIKVENPANTEAFFYYQQLDCWWMMNPRGKQVEGKKGADGIAFHPMQPPEALDFFIKHYRSKVQDLKVIGSQDLPGLPKAFHVQMQSTLKGIGEKITYTLDGKPVEEEFYGVWHYTVNQGEALWGLTSVHSFRAPVGTVAKRRNVFAAMAKSVQPTRQFVQHVVAVRQQLVAKWQANINATKQEVADAKARSEQLTAQDNQFLAGVDANLASQRAAEAASARASSAEPARTANDAQDDYIRGVVTMNDPTTGTSQQSMFSSYHWTDGYSYIDSNDANYNPNHTQNGNWTLMTPAQ